MCPSIVVYRQKLSSGTAIFLSNSKERNPIVNFVRSSLDEKKCYGSRETRLIYIEAEFSASVGTPPRFKDQGSDAAP